MQTLSRVLLFSALTVDPAIVLAADLSLKPGKPAMLPPIHSWTGFYLGLNAGYGDGRWDSDVGLRTAPERCSCTLKSNSFGRTTRHSGAFVGGGQLGYLYQFPQGWVVGAEADIQYAGLRDENSLIDPYPQIRKISAIENKLDWYGTARLRTGYAFDRVLIYGTSGVAFGRIKSYASYDETGGSQTDTKTGWALGGGLEYALTEKWSVRAEYLYLDFGKPKELVFQYTKGADFYDRPALSIQTIRAGLNYRF